MSTMTMDLAKTAQDIFLFALDAVMPKHLLERRIVREENALMLRGNRIDLCAYENIYVLGAGKASAAMALVMENILGDHLNEGVCVVKYGHTAPLKKIKIIEAAHPIPDENGIRGGKAITELAGKASARDLVFCLISGGGSALLVAPQEGINLPDLQSLSNSLLRAGANIHELNAVRKHLSRVKGGRLAELIFPARIVSLLISDVIGDSLDVIASGPTAPDSSSFQDACRVLQKYDSWDSAPGPVRRYLERGLKGEEPETPKQGNPAFETTMNWIIGNNGFALSAAALKARNRGFNPVVLTSGMFGEARNAAHTLVSVAREIAEYGRPVSPPACVIMGGETTVTVRGNGRGGRCTEFALSAGMAMKPDDRFVILAAGTDGTDGPTDAAGAFVTADIIPDAIRSGLNPADYLGNNDSYSFFKTTGNLIMTGPTLTNVMDIMMALVR